MMSSWYYVLPLSRKSRLGWAIRKPGAWLHPDTCLNAAATRLLVHNFDRYYHQYPPPPPFDDASILQPHDTQMFKVVLSRVFDLRCNLEEIAGAGEPLLLFSKDEGEAAAGKGKSAAGGAPSAESAQQAATVGAGGKGDVKSPPK